MLFWYFKSFLIYISYFIFFSFSFTEDKLSNDELICRGVKTKKKKIITGNFFPCSLSGLVRLAKHVDR